MKKELVKQEFPLSQGQKNFLKNYKAHKLMIIVSRLLLLAAFLLLSRGKTSLPAVELVLVPQ